jgi:RHS repeat-associated protein
MAATYRYDPFGRTTSSSGALASANLYRFSSKMVHANSGLYYYGRRFYEPNLQRWINRDPIGERGGVNMYQVAGNDLLNHVDSSGLLFIPQAGGPLEAYRCARGISREVSREYCDNGPKQDPRDHSCREAHCITNCRITRECPGARLTAWAASWYKELSQPAIKQHWSEVNRFSDIPLYLTGWDPGDSPGDMAANKIGRNVACRRQSRCEELCREALPQLIQLSL